MTLRTPRRRISPRTKLRYRAIREFFRRALGSTSQQEIKINSSIAVNVTDLKRKIVGLEQQLDEVNKHCRDFACLEDCSRIDSRESGFQYDFRHEIDTIKELTEGSSEKKSNGIETQLIYKSSDCNCQKSEVSDHLPKPDFDNKLVNDQMDYSGHVTKVKNKKSKIHHNTNTNSKLHKHKARSVYDSMTAHSTSSFHSLANNRVNDINTDYPDNSYDKKRFKKENFIEPIPHPKDKKYKEFIKKNRGDQYKVSYEETPAKFRKQKRNSRELDPDFIADIIRKQYKPVKMFGRKESDFSQFSAPVCRDQEFSIRENIQEGSELCSCLYPEIGRRQKRMKRQDLNGMRSVCDTRLYSSNRHTRHKHRRMHADVYSNSDMYDLVPVKERSSPKTRKKFIDENIFPYEYYREVPPSPRTLRPRLNLQAQYYTELEDYMAHNKQKHRRRFPRNQKVYPEYQEHFEVDTASEFVPERNIAQAPNQQKLINVNIPIEDKHLQNQSPQETGTPNNLQHSQYINEQTSTAVDSSLNKTQETDINVDKTDKALCEIKDILQSFLHEIKKETVASQCDKSDFTYKTQDNENNIKQEPNTKINSHIQNSGSYNNYVSGQVGMPPYISPFATNPYCYPVMPMCPLNYPMQLQNGGYLMPSQSYTCSNCVAVPKESVSVHCCNKNTEPTGNTETDELIKEIYKFVAQGPVGKHGQDYTNDRKRDDSQAEDKILTSRSVGGSFKNYQHDVKVGTQPLKCYSKSCEAIGTRMVSDTYYSGTNASYSDTLLEKLSLEAGTTSETELDMEAPDQNKNKVNKLSKVLRSFGLFKKKKKDVIEELSETESVTEEDIKPKQPPFRQQVTNYMMHGQEYFRSPPLKPLYERRQEYQPPTNDYRHGKLEYPQGPHGYDTRQYEYHPRPHEFQPRQQDYQSRRHEYQPRANEYQHRPHEYQPDYHPPYNPGERGYTSPRLNDPYGQQQQPQQHDHPSIPPPHLRQRPTAPPFSSSYDTSYSQMQPPLCLKEIEVKSTGTQSERKMSIFRKFGKKKQQPVIITHMAAAGDQRSFSTQTAVNTSLQMNRQQKMTKPLFNWKSFQEKAKKAIPSPDLDPIAYSYQTQKELAQGNLKMRNAVLKKIFYKRNPFSPRNLIVKTLLGKDKSSFGDATGVLRPRMFF
ncbi:unnamed protein product [Arctia plantaginis]|uniref:Uncharacterized protein n=1 Tax=Arctia plantaginis TaxID=874455 RepID=A0A8S1APP4_ARCPL|nr:unnamed protein product [Arctia plantaginis]